MAREIVGSVATGNFPPMIGLRTKGNFVKGVIQALGQTNNRNPVVTLSLLDLEGTSMVSTSKGVYEDTPVDVGDAVQVIGSVKQLKEKLPLLKVGETVTITFLGKKKIPGGKTLNEFRVEVNEEAA